MKQEIVCQQGKCFETKTMEYEFDNIFKDNAIADKIKKEMIMDSMNHF